MTDIDYALPLQRFVANPGQHASWLATLSLLEYTGARKISRTFRRPNAEVMEHFAEEARHALFFKEKALKLDPRARPMLALPARRYFERLDAGVTDILRAGPGYTPERAYVLVTTAIEERATELYRVYNRILLEQSQSFRLDGILAEEGRHLIFMQRLLDETGVRVLLPTALQLEKEHFAAFWRTLAA